MPEGPEVKLIVQKISKIFRDSELYNIKINSGRYKTGKKPNGYDIFLKGLPAKIKNFHTHGKFIWIVLDNNSYIWITLGLTGMLEIIKNKHSHLTFETSKGDFYMSDMRNFGTIKFSLSEDELKKKIKQLGFDPLKKNFTQDEFIHKIRKLKNDKIIGQVLNDQKVIAGIGNYLRAEVLYSAKISPYRKLKDLSDQDLENLYQNIIKITNKSYNKQLKDGLHTYNFQVYKRSKTINNENVVGNKFGERTLWWVPGIQK